MKSLKLEFICGVMEIFLLDWMGSVIRKCQSLRKLKGTFFSIGKCWMHCWQMMEPDLLRWAGASRENEVWQWEHSLRSGISPRRLRIFILKLDSIRWKLLSASMAVSASRVSWKRWSMDWFSSVIFLIVLRISKLSSVLERLFLI